MTNHNLMTRLADLRRRRGLTQHEVAHRMGLSRRSRQYIRLIETGAIDSQLSTTLRYADAVGVGIVIQVDPPADGGAR